jgi:ATP-dependent Clp protease ATP-binding subunit ClpB
MDPNKCTQKVADVINAARDLALEQSQQQLSPLHVACVMFEDPEGIARHAVLKSSNEDVYRAIVRSLKKALVKLPTMDPPPDEVFMSADLKRAFQAANKMSKAKKDTYLGALGPQAGCLPPKRVACTGARPRGAAAPTPPPCTPLILRIPRPRPPYPLPPRRRRAAAGGA